MSCSYSATVLTPQKIAQERFITNGDIKNKVGGYQLQGISIAGQETCLIFPELKLSFDSGRCPQRAVYQPVVLLSHAHMDHIAGLPPHIASRSLLKLSPSIVILPKVIVNSVQKLIEVHRELDGSDMPCELVGMEPGDTHILPNNLIVRTFQTYHPVPSQGYVLYSQKNKLKQQYVGMKGDQIRDLRKSGVEVSDRIIVPEIAYTGDTSIQWLSDDSNEVVKDALNAKLLITECSFLDEDTMQQTDKFGHQHLFELVKNKQKFAQVENLMLNHFSARYKVSQIQEIMQEKWPPELRDKTHFFLAGLQ